MWKPHDLLDSNEINRIKNTEAAATLLELLMKESLLITHRLDLIMKGAEVLRKTE